jgi:hypothetical protein
MTITTITILGIFHLFKTFNDTETRFCLRLRVEPTQLVTASARFRTGSETETSSIYWAEYNFTSKTAVIQFLYPSNGKLTRDFAPPPCYCPTIQKKNYH